tara:strand:- start:45 stop:401 length:357 start_codon:yes stop_codon:yes gene_type:complete
VRSQHALRAIHVRATLDIVLAPQARKTKAEEATKMKISKAKLRQIIKEELAEAEETPRMSPSEAGAKWTEDEEIFKAAVYAAVDAGLTMRAIRNMVEEVFQKIDDEPTWSGNENPLSE